MMKNDHFTQIYCTSGKNYHKMISVEDVDKNLKPALLSITSFKNKRIIDLGSGTGRIPLLFPEQRIISLDLHADMLEENINQQKLSRSNWPAIQGDMRLLPFSPNSFDIATAGWSIGHFTGWYKEDWKAQIERVLHQTNMLLKPGGCMIIPETLSTGNLIPTPPNAELAKYYNWLETTHHFQHQKIQTDYLFDSLEDSIFYSRFFFGEDLTEKVRHNKWVRLPEWTGIWYKFKN